MATSRGQRTGIWIICGVLTIGTLAGFVAMIIQPQNDANDTARIQKLTSDYQNEYEAYQTKVDAQTKALSDQYYATFKEYASKPAAFDASSVTALTTEDLKVGTGDEVTDGTTYSAYYIGWNPKGKVFDQSIDGEALKAPLNPTSVITGWSEGVKGMKIGGVRLLSIPSDKAYGETGSGDDIPANTPIKFVVMAIPAVEQISEPEMSDELLQYYQTLYGQ